MSKYFSIAALSEAYPDKFGVEKMRPYIGAIWNEKTVNDQGRRLEKYYRSVIAESDENVKYSLLFGKMVVLTTPLQVLFGNSSLLGHDL